MYSLAIYKTGIVQPIGLPFHFDENEKLIDKYAITEKTDTLKLTIAPKDKGFEYYDNEQGRHFVIYYYNDKWIPINTLAIPGRISQDKKWENIIPDDKSKK